MIHQKIQKKNSAIPQGKIELKLNSRNPLSNRAFEIFVCNDGFIEFYDAENPRDGFYFGEFKELQKFANSLNTLLDAIPSEEGA